MRARIMDAESATALPLLIDAEALHALIGKKTFCWST